MATVQGVYLALFGRPADPAGLTYWNGVTKAGADLNAMLTELPALPEYTSRFTNMSNEQIVKSIYQALFGRDPEPKGLAEFVAALDNKTQTISSIAVNILDGAQGSDKARIDAKLAASDIFTAQMDLPAEQAAYNANTIIIAREYLSGVNENTPGTAALADAAIAKMLQQGGGAPVADDPGPNGAPVFTTGNTADVDEHAAVGTIVYDANATDDNPFPVRYDLVGADKDFFDIDPDTGVVTVKVSPDYEVDGGTLNIGVRAIDSTGFASVKGVTVTVNNLDEESPVITSSAAVSVNENIGANKVVHTVVATDDIAVTKYEITGGADAAKFTIAADGKVTLADDPNFEAKKEYKFEVTASDAAGKTAKQTVTLSINDLVEDSTFSDNAATNNVDFTGSKNNWTINGLAGNDTIKGGLGNDIITGGSGKDTMTGGGGNNIFKFDDGDSVPGAVDVITDFVKGKDLIDLSAVDAKESYQEWGFIGPNIWDWGWITRESGDQPFSGVANTNNPAYGQIGVFNDGVNTYIVADTTEGNANDVSLRIQLTGVHNLTAADFVL